MVHILHTSDQEITGHYLECHGTRQRSGETIDEWVAKMVNKLGPDDCKFLLRNIEPHLVHLWITNGHYLYDPKISNAGRFTWGEAAAKCTNNGKIEAVRIINDQEALDSKGRSYKMVPYNPDQSIIDD